LHGDTHPIALTIHSGVVYGAVRPRRNDVALVVSICDRAGWPPLPTGRARIGVVPAATGGHVVDQHHEILVLDAAEPGHHSLVALGKGEPMRIGTGGGQSRTVGDVLQRGDHVWRRWVGERGTVVDLLDGDRVSYYAEENRREERAVRRVEGDAGDGQ